MEKTAAYIQLLEMSDALQNTTYLRSMVSEEYSGNYLKRTSTGMTTSTLRNQFTQITLDWIHELSNPTALFIIQHLAQELKRFNLLWYRAPTRKTAENKILRELIDKDIIRRTEVIGIYLVNPVKLWRGTIHSAVEATKTLLRENGGKPKLDLIKDLKPNGDYLLNTNQDHIDKMLM